jgi:hypothetical protein
MFCTLKLPAFFFNPCTSPRPALATLDSDIADSDDDGDNDDGEGGERDDDDVGTGTSSTSWPCGTTSHGILRVSSSAARWRVHAVQNTPPHIRQ